MLAFASLQISDSLSIALIVGKRSVEETKAAAIQLSRMVKSGMIDLGISSSSEEVFILTQEIRQASKKAKAGGEGVEEEAAQEEEEKEEDQEPLIDLPGLELNDIQGTLTWMKQFVARWAAS